MTQTPNPEEVARRIGEASALIITTLNDHGYEGAEIVAACSNVVSVFFAGAVKEGLAYERGEDFMLELMAGMQEQFERQFPALNRQSRDGGGS